MEFIKRLAPDVPDTWDPDSVHEVDEAHLLEEQLLLHEDQYTSDGENISVVVGSWNVNQKQPPAEAQLRRWLHLDTDPPPDVVGVGLQELDMSVGAMLREETPAAAPWSHAFKNAARDQWSCVGERQLVGLYLIVLVRKALLTGGKDAPVGEFAISSVRCGAMNNAMANKGGVGLRLRVHRTSFAFVTMHLAAHMSHVERRNRDFLRIYDMMHFSVDAGALPVLLRDQERIFFFGDLNYRVEMGYDEVLSLIDKREWQRLHDCDQLRRQLKLGETLYARLGIRDALPSFAPTYKYDAGTLRYDTSEKRRVPAWTDRVLWWAPPYCKADLLRPGVAGLDTGPPTGHGSATERARDPMSLQNFWREEMGEHRSDHRPVTAHFDVAVKVELPEEKERIRVEIRRRMEKFGQDEFLLPKIEHDRSDIQFGDVCFGDGPVEEIRLSNRGHAVTNVMVHSYAPPESTGRVVFSKQWISVNRLELRIAPRNDGGREEILRVQCCVDKESVRGLHDGGPFRAAPEDTQPPVLAHWLLLSAGQQRFFFECTARVAPSCFGSWLTHLEMCGLVPVKQAYQLGPDQQPPPPRRPSVPKELWFMVDYITRYGTQTPDLFQDDISPQEFQRLRQRLDECGDGFVEGSFSVRAVGQALLKFLADLQEPVVIPALHERCLARPPHAQAAQIISELPTVHFNVFTYIVAFLKFLLTPANSEANLLTPELLAQGFGPVLLQRGQARRLRLRRGAAVSTAAAEAERAGATHFLLGFLA